jgi:hypothetical protein
MHCYERMTKFRGFDISSEINVAINETSAVIQSLHIVAGPLARKSESLR